MTAVSRRALLTGIGVGAASVAAVGVGAAAIARQSEDEPVATGRTYDFYGAHQAGIVTPMQDHLHAAAFDLTTTSRDDLVRLLQAWSAAAAAMTAGSPVGLYGAVNGPYDAPPDDTGEALDLPASGLTITIGLGPSLFRTSDGVDRFGLADRLPAGFGPLPAFPRDTLDEAICGGDLFVQACADEAQVAVHAVRTFAREAFGTAAVRWSQLGFGRSSVTSSADSTPRNLFGFKDGTNNITSDDAAGLDDFVWVQPEDGTDWMTGGSYLAVRKIRMTIETWDRTSLREQEAVFGRTKREGSPLSGGTEHTVPDFAATGRDGAPLIPTDSHMALAHPSANDGHRILRRAYNYTDGSDGLGRLEAGLFFLGYARDLSRQFVPMQLRLSRSDRMNEYVRYQSSAAFAIPPGAAGPGGFVGERLFA